MVQKIASSNLVVHPKNATVAQLVLEHSVEARKVPGSSPGRSTKGDVAQ